MMMAGSKICKCFFVMCNKGRVYHNDIRLNFPPFLSFLYACNYFCSIIALMLIGMRRKRRIARMKRVLFSVGFALVLILVGTSLASAHEVAQTQTPDLVVGAQIYDS